MAAKKKKQTEKESQQQPQAEMQAAQAAKPAEDQPKNFNYQLPDDDIIHTEALNPESLNQMPESEEAQAVDGAQEDVQDDPQGDLDVNPQMIAALNQKITALEQQLEEQKDRMLRLAAEAENIRRRATKEKEDAQKYGITNFAKDLLGVADSLGRAADALNDEAVAAQENLKPLQEGVKMTDTMLQDCLARHKITKVSGVGSKFSYDHHQAMQQVDSQTHESNTIIQVLQ
ncbi:MAG: nucleotide exchange factor GrpE, partial [Alphaproteobacteria bacterium]